MLRRRPGSPKPTTFQHYLEQPNWTDVSDKPRLHHYGISDAKIRGHKLYWRQNTDIQSLQNENTDGTKPNVETEFYPLKERTRFQFRVYFENLTEEELGALAWVLTLPSDDELYHAVGMGKPYGLGVVKTFLDRLVVTDRTQRYQSLFAEGGSWANAERDATEQTGAYIEAFKRYLGEYGIDFDSSERIQQLVSMLKLYDADPELFSYMQIEGPNGNEYKDRPVLPRPKAVEEQYREKEGAERHKRLKQEKKRIKSEGLGARDIVVGEIFDKSDDIWFAPQKVQLGDYTYNLEGLIDGFHPYMYEAQIPAVSVVSRKGNTVRARVVEIHDGDPIELVCEQLE